MESTIIKDLKRDFYKTYVVFEELNLIIRLTTISRILMNMIDGSRSNQSDVINDRMEFYTASFLSSIEDLKNITDTYGSIVSFSNDFTSKYGSISTIELNYGENYTDLSPLIAVINSSYETAISKYINKALLFSVQVDNILNNVTFNSEDEHDFERNFYFIIENGKAILRESSEYASKVITDHINSLFSSKKKVH
jgi:hypothetical protein